MGERLGKLLERSLEAARQVERACVAARPGVEAFVLFVCGRRTGSLALEEVVDVARNQATADTRTYFPEGSEAQIVDFVQALADRGILAPTSKAALVAPDNSRVELPEPLHAVLVQVAEALMQGMAVSVIPQSARLTTQQAADFLGVSRPTLVRLLERGEIPMSKPGRHRYVQLQDLVTYQDAMQSRRREILDTMATEAAEAGLYEATDGPPPALH